MFEESDPPTEIGAEEGPEMAPTEESTDPPEKVKRTVPNRQYPVDPRVWKPVFLKAYANSGNIALACAAAHVARSTYTTHMREDPVFAAGLEEARLSAIDILYGALFERALVSDTPAAIFLLRNLDPARFNDRRKLELEIRGVVEVNHQLDMGEVRAMLKVLVATGQIDVEELMGVQEQRQLDSGALIEGEATEIDE